MKNSYIATAIDSEYRRKKYYSEKVKRQTCIIDKEKQCDKCKYKGICKDNE